MRIDSSGRVGIGVTPKSTWISDLKVLQIGGLASLTGGTLGWGGFLELGTNFYRDSGGFKRLSGTTNYNFAVNYEQSNSNGSHNFKVAGTGIADSAITWSTALKVANDGNIGVNTLLPEHKLACRWRCNHKRCPLRLNQFKRSLRSCLDKRSGRSAMEDD